MKNQAQLAMGMMIGAGIMYLLDPDRGTRRRALIRDQMRHAGNEIGGIKEELDRTGRDLRNRARGAVAETKGSLRRQQVEDDVLEARVRSEVGHAVSNIGNLEVHADHGRVTIGGTVPPEEIDALVHAVEHVRGVREVNNRLQVPSD